jgi:hypothetical protein
MIRCIIIALAYECIQESIFLFVIMKPPRRIFTGMKVFDEKKDEGESEK